VSPRVEDKWAGQEAAEHYARARFASPRAAGRDPALVRALLARHAPPSLARLLDAPCGSGRLAPALLRAERRVHLDANLPMLEAARAALGEGRAVQGSLFALPFAGQSFDVVVSCRFLHHLHGADELARAVGELVRVSRALVVASFWDGACLPALRVRLGLKRSEGPRGRVYRSRGEIAAAFARAGAPVVEFAPVLRFVSAQTFLAARRSDVP
jgi:SAM-dependent methyltransferase